jgi:glycosyltransferase involved in cell wall biosynthesis
MSRTQHPLVTVLMPVYNCASYVRDAVDSILQQTFTDFELLIVNDGSVDDTQEIINSYEDPRIRVLVSPENRGIPVTLNLGLAHARGKLVAHHDADDVSHPTRLEHQVAFLESHSDIAWLGSQARYWQAGKLPRRSSVRWRALGTEAIKFQSLFGNPFVHSAVMYRRSIVWGQLHGYDCNYRICPDYELCTRVLEKHRAVNFAYALVDYRINPGSISRTITLTDVRAREALLRRTLRLLWPHLGELDGWAMRWANANFGRFESIEELRHTVRVARLCLDRCLPGKERALRAQMRRIYAVYLLGIAARQRQSNFGFACSCVARALGASPVITLTAVEVWVRGKLPGQQREPARAKVL